MKIVIQNVFGLLCFVIYQYLCLAKENVNIGVMFNNFEPQIFMPLNKSVDPMYTYNKPVDFSSTQQQVSDTDIYYAGTTLCQMLGNENGVSVILGPASTITSPLLESICSRFQIPYILTSWREPNEADKTLTINFYPENTLLSRGIANIIENENWQNFVILYENEESLIKMQEILKLQKYQKGEKKNNVFARHLGSGPDFRPLLKQLINIDSIILDCKTENIIPILIQAKDLNMMDIQDTYLLTSLDAHTLDFSFFEPASIITLSLFDYNSAEFKNKIFSWETVGFEAGSGRRKIIEPKSITTEAALFYDIMNIFTEAVYDIHSEETPIHSEETPIQSFPIQCDGETIFNNGIQLRDSIKRKSGISDLTGPIEFDDFGNRIDFNLYAMDAIKDEVLSSWSAKNQSIIGARSSDATDDAAVHNLQKITVIVSSRIGEPYLMRVDPQEGEELTGNARFKGYSLDLIDGIAKIIGFKYVFRLAEDGKYGNYDEKSQSWTGIVGDLLERKAHLGICDLTITPERREVVDFSAPFMTLGISILYKKPEKEEMNMFAFMEPFHVSVWFYTATLYLVISVILYFVSRMTPGDWENPHPCDENPEELENIWDIKNCLWLTLGSIMTQGCDILPKGISSRIAVAMWWFFSLIMTSTYTANLAAFLTKKNMEIPIDSAEALAKQTKIKYGTLSGGATESFFRTSNFSTYQRMWNNMKETKSDLFVTDNNDGVNRVLTTKNSLYAYLMESTGIEYHTKTKCELKQIGGWLDSKGFGIAMPINAPYRSRINKAILKMQESGELQTLKKKWWEEERPEKKRCTEEEDEEEGAKLALSSVGGVFLLLGVGIGLSVLFAILEFLWNVRNVSVEEHLTFWEALKMELKFASSFWITKKRTKPETSESASGKSDKSFRTDNKSIVHSILQNASSFIHLNNLSDRPSCP